MLRLVGVLIAATSLTSVSGCAGRPDPWVAGRPKVVEVSGVIAYDGAPIEGAVVTLAPVSGSHSAYGRSDAEGKFQLTTFEDGDGAVPGEYQVTVSKVVVEYTPNPTDPDHLPPLHYKEYSAIPKEYGSVATSGLKASVTDAGPNDLSLVLSSKPPR